MAERINTHDTLTREHLVPEAEVLSESEVEYRFREIVSSLEAAAEAAQPSVEVPRRDGELSYPQTMTKIAGAQDHGRRFGI